MSYVKDTEWTDRQKGKERGQDSQLFAGQDNWRGKVEVERVKKYIAVRPEYGIISSCH